jgi:hypothetical protein
MHVRVNDVSREVDAQTDADDQNGAGHGVDFKIWKKKFESFFDFNDWSVKNLFQYAK